jgi:hypothetical protein
MGDDSIESPLKGKWVNYHHPSIWKLKYYVFYIVKKVEKTFVQHIILEVSLQQTIEWDINGVVGDLIPL